MQTWTRACLVESVSDIPRRWLLPAAPAPAGRALALLLALLDTPPALLAPSGSRMRRNLYTQSRNAENSERAHGPGVVGSGWDSSLCV